MMPAPDHREEPGPEVFLPQVEAVEARLSNLNLVDTVLLTGSSIMEFWETSSQDLLPLKTVNIGIGGTRICDQIAYFDRLLRPHQARAIVIYAGSNDINGVPGITKTAEEVAALVNRYLDLIRAHFPVTPLFYISIIEAPSKQAFAAEIREANRLIAASMAAGENLHFIDCSRELVNEQGQPDRSLYLEDHLHFRPEGYRRWRAAIRPVLLEFLT